MSTSLDIATRTVTLTIRQWNDIIQAAMRGLDDLAYHLNDYPQDHQDSSDPIGHRENIGYKRTQNSLDLETSAVSALAGQVNE